MATRLQASEKAYELIKALPESAELPTWTPVLENWTLNMYRLNSGEVQGLLYPISEIGRVAVTDGIELQRVTPPVTLPFPMLRIQLAKEPINIERAKSHNILIPITQVFESSAEKRAFRDSVGLRMSKHWNAEVRLSWEGDEQGYYYNPSGD